MSAVPFRTLKKFLSRYFHFIFMQPSFSPSAFIMSNLDNYFKVFEYMPNDILIGFLQYQEQLFKDSLPNRSLNTLCISAFILMISFTKFYETDKQIFFFSVQKFDEELILLGTLLSLF